MEKFKTQVDLIENTNGTYSVDYSIFSPGKRYGQGTITQSQITEYDSQTHEIPGINVVVMLDDEGNGNPTAVAGSFNINASLVLDSAKPFLEVLFKVTEGGVVKEKGGVIVRGYVPS